MRDVLLNRVEVTNRKRRAVLVVDDDPAMRRMISVILKSGGYSPYTAENGEECLGLLTRILPNAILLDINMPKLDGLSLCKEIMLKFPDLHCPIIFLTSRATPEAISFAKEAGAKGFIAKPIKPMELLNRLDSFLRPNSAAGMSL